MRHAARRAAAAACVFSMAAVLLAADASFAEETQPRQLSPVLIRDAAKPIGAGARQSSRRVKTTSQAKSHPPATKTRLRWRTSRKANPVRTAAGEQSSRRRYQVQPAGGATPAKTGVVQAADWKQDQKASGPALRSAAPLPEADPLADPFGDQVTAGPSAKTKAKLIQLDADDAPGIRRPRLQPGGGQDAPGIRRPRLQPSETEDQPGPGLRLLPQQGQPEDGIPAPGGVEDDPPVDPRRPAPLPEPGESAAEKQFRHLQREWRRVRDLNNCSEEKGRLFADKLSKTGRSLLDISPVRASRSSRFVQLVSDDDYLWETKDGKILGRGKPTGYDPATETLSLKIEPTLEIRIPIEKFDPSYDEATETLTVTCPDNDEKKSIRMVHISDFSRSDLGDVIIQYRPPCDGMVTNCEGKEIQCNPQVKLDDLEAGSRAYFLDNWKKTWTTKDGQTIARWARPIFYRYGRIELETVTGSRLGVELRNLMPEDQTYFRKKWRLPLYSRTWRTTDGQQTIEGKLYDYNNGRAYIQTAGDRIVAIPLSRLSAKDSWYVTDGWELPPECRLSENHLSPAQLRSRGWVDMTFTWKASALCHKPLYFENVQLERYGHSAGPILQPVLSTAHFFGKLPILPYKIGMNLPNECQYSLGYYRPGSCAPYLVDPIPIHPRGALFQAAATTGLVYLIP